MRPITVSSVLRVLGPGMSATSKGAADVRMTSEESLGTVVEVVLGVDTHLDVHVAVALDQLGRDALASWPCRRPPRATRASSVGCRASVR
jgi:hypothetical protein